MGPHRISETGLSSIQVILSRMRSATLNALICANCGYCEFYSDEKGLQNVKRYGKQFFIKNL